MIGAVRILLRGASAALTGCVAPPTRSPRAVTGGVVRRWTARAWPLPLILALGGCVTPPVAPRAAISAAEAARIRTTCPEGSFIGTMTVTCPEIAP